MMKNRTNIVVFVLALMGVSFFAGIQACETHEAKPAQSERFEQIDNEHIHSWRSVIMPDQPLKLHRHKYPRQVTALTDGVLERTLENGEVISRHEWKAGESYWLDADPETQLHYCVNAGSEPLIVVVTEVK